MDITIFPHSLHGIVPAIASKSQAHRLLICAAFADNSTTLLCPDTNRDIAATVACLQALGAKITRTQNTYSITPVRRLPSQAVLPCGESGSTLRFLLPIVGALGVDATFQMDGRLPERPLSPLWEEMERMGCHLSRPTLRTIRCQGCLRSGNYRIEGGTSSQFITGLLFALSLIPGQTHLDITGRVESRPYLDLTRQAMDLFNAPDYHTPGTISIEGDWSNAAFFLAAQALGNAVSVTGLSDDSVQGDRLCSTLLPQLHAGFVQLSVADIPDLVPILAVVAGACHGAVFSDIQRLRLKESDRVATVLAMLHSLGGQAVSDSSTLTVYGTGYHGGTVDAANDHRIAMAAAIAATIASAPVTILGAECVSKSYPTFWDEYCRLGGIYEQHIR